MADAQLYGIRPGLFHMTNVMLHAANTVLLFLVIRRYTGTVWRSAVVAGLFAWHPLNVESVAWISERKGLFSTFFFLLMLLSYQRYCRRPSGGGYTIVFCLFLLGLMAKSTIVVAPLLLLLLDFWPLGRLRFVDLGGDDAKEALWSGKTTCSAAVTVRRLLLEKLPFFALSMLFTLLTIEAERRAGALSALDVSLYDRMANGLVSFPLYLLKFLCPLNLAAIYPHPGIWPWPPVLEAAGILVSLSGLAYLTLKSRPYIFVGWGFFCVGLLPTAGFFQVGWHAMADRYAYIPLIGLFVLLVWGANEVLQSRCSPNNIRTVRSLLMLLPFMVLYVVSHQQLKSWSSSVALFEHAVKNTSKNYIALTNLGNALAGEGQLERGISCLRDALAFSPDKATQHFNLANLLFKAGAFKEAVGHYYKTLGYDNEDPVVRQELAWALTICEDGTVRNGPEAVRVVKEIWDRGPHDFWTGNILAAAYAECRHFEKAIEVAEEALSLAASARNSAVIEVCQRRVSIYRSRKSLRE